MWPFKGGSIWKIYSTDVRQQYRTRQLRKVHGSQTKIERSHTQNDENDISSSNKAKKYRTRDARLDISTLVSHSEWAWLYKRRQFVQLLPTLPPAWWGPKLGHFLNSGKRSIEWINFALSLSLLIPHCIIAIFHSLLAVPL